MARSPSEIVASVRRFRYLWAERRETHPDPVVRRMANPILASYDAAVKAADDGAPLAVVCSRLSRYGYWLHGCGPALDQIAAIEAEARAAADDPDSDGERYELPDRHEGASAA